MNYFIISNAWESGISNNNVFHLLLHGTEMKLLASTNYMPICALLFHKIYSVQIFFLAGVEQ